MKTTFIVSTFAAFAGAVSAVAVPQSAPADDPNNVGYISQQEAEQYVAQFATVFGKQGDWQTRANTILTPDFQAYSNSILSLQDLPLGTPGQLAKSREDYIQGQEHTPVTSGFNTYDIIVSGNKLIWEWYFTGVGDGKYQVDGFNKFLLTRNLTNWGQLQAYYLHLEFDSVAWGEDTTLEITFPNGAVVKGPGAA